MSDEKTWRECECGAVNKFSLTLPSSIHCDECGALVAETEEPIESEFVGLNPLTGRVFQVNSKDTVTGVNWDDDRVRVTE